VASKDGRAVPAIFSLLKRESNEIDRVVELFDALTKIGLDTEQSRMVLSLASSDDRDSRLLGLRALDYFPDPEAMGLLIMNIRSIDEGIVQHSCDALCGAYEKGLDCSEAIEAIFQRMGREKDSRVRKYVLENALLNMGVKEERIRERCMDLVDLNDPFVHFIEAMRSLHLYVKDRYARMYDGEPDTILLREVTDFLAMKGNFSDQDVDAAIKKCMEAKRERN